MSRLLELGLRVGARAWVLGMALLLGGGSGCQRPAGADTARGPERPGALAQEHGEGPAQGGACARLRRPRGIEAARAGQEGQGFRVVAVEIRSLADRSVKETVAVREQLRRSSGAMRNTVAITTKGRARMEEELEQVRTGGERLEELTRMLQASSTSLRRIVKVVKQQHEGVGQIFSAVNELSRTTDKAVVSVDAMRQSAEQLRSTTVRLTEALSGFRL